MLLVGPVHLFSKQNTYSRIRKEMLVMLKMMSLPNIKLFREVIEKSRGAVMLHLPDNTYCNLKENHAALELLGITHLGTRGLDISLSNPADMAMFVQYMMETAPQ